MLVGPPAATSSGASRRVIRSLCGVFVGSIMALGSLLAFAWLPYGSTRLPFGSLWFLFGYHSSLWLPFGSLSVMAPFCSRLAAFGLCLALMAPFGARSASLWLRFGQRACGRGRVRRERRVPRCSLGVRPGIPTQGSHTWRRSESNRGCARGTPEARSVAAKDCKPLRRGIMGSLLRGSCHARPRGRTVAPHHFASRFPVAFSRSNLPAAIGVAETFARSCKHAAAYASSGFGSACATQARAVLSRAEAA